jgi:hypothetical protein
MLIFEKAARQDHRDVVFGLHSLARRYCTDATSVDYSKDTFEIYNSIVFHYQPEHRGQSAQPAAPLIMLRYRLHKVSIWSPTNAQDGNSTII